jgi:hypothetical protein
VSQHPRIVKSAGAVYVYLYLHNFDSGGGLNSTYALEKDFKKYFEKKCPIVSFWTPIVYMRGENIGASLLNNSAP